MKFRKLTNRELEALEKDFITFLAANSITAADWEKLKNNEQKKADALIELFSDIVFEKAFTNCKCLEQVGSHEFRTYRFFDDEVKMIAVRVSRDLTVNLTKGKLGDTLNDLLKNKTDSVEIYEATKKYNKLREQEMFDIMESGAYMANDELYNQLKELIS
ncbi:DUF6495 family protein [Salibacter sp.]|uniref:DUF6495 family protein n=1 Tax=Salibacter sp. TaxID=2010995 RepID=UPI0028709481|nr:DUF6495 family protein [Salibacter sp.]MDR9399482.1 DUF6495 family protein [Salibacter sp.]MDR9487738.1 DUF6495 family protein [Salibacter sp.]